MSYTASISNLTLFRERISRRLISLAGTCNISEYNQIGEEITDITREFKDVPKIICEGLSSNGYIIKWDTTSMCFKAYYADSATTEHTHDFEQWELPTETKLSVTMTDDDDAATHGVPVYLRTYNGHDAQLEFVSPTTANGLLQLNDTDTDGLFLRHNVSAASRTYPLYFTEDEDDLLRLYAAIPLFAETQIMFMPTLEGRLIPICPVDKSGVLVYFDEDAVNTYERLLYVSPTDTDGEAFTAEHFMGEWNLEWEFTSTAGGGGTASSAVEVADYTDVGDFDFLAVGRRK